MGVLQFDEEASKRLLAVYQTPDVVQQRREVLNSINIIENERVLDVGSGPGFLTRSMAEKTGPDGKVLGIDISEFLLQHAKSIKDDLPQIEFRIGDVMDTGCLNAEFDTVVCTQVLEYVQDIDPALMEFNRVLRKGGKIALLDTDWDSIVWNSNNRSRMAKILKAWEAHATHPFLPRTLASKMRSAGFMVNQVKVIPLLNPAFNSNTYSNRMIDLIVSFVTQNGTIKKEEADDWANDLRSQQHYFFSLNRYLFTGIKR